MKMENKKRLNFLSYLVILLTLFINVNSVTIIDFEDGLIPNEITFDSNNPVNWSISLVDGSNVIHNDDLLDNQKTSFLMQNLEIGQGDFSFDYKTSTETNFDFLEFYINDLLIFKDSGNNNTWTNYSYYIDNGRYNLTFTYNKDSTASIGQDSVFIDNIVFEDYINISANDTIQNIPDTNLLIFDYSPKNVSNISNLFNFEIELNYVASCDLYIDNSKVISFDNQTSYSYEYLINEEKTINYYWYCEGYINNTLNFEKTNKEELNIILGTNSVSFALYDELDNLFYGENLYLVTPCLKEYINIYQTALNQNEPKYIQKITNGLAQFNLNYTNEYNFCLVRGQINYQDDSFSTNFDLVEINKQLDLGTLFVKNDTLSYSFRIANTDIYQMYEPNFWDKTWADLFNLVISFIFGGVIMLLGIITKSEKVIVAGVFVLMAGMGISTINLVGGFLF